MARRWFVPRFNSGKSIRFESHKYKILTQPPITSRGRAFCPRCVGRERQQRELVTVMQQYLGGEFGDLTGYFVCEKCGLYYVYEQENVAL